MPVVPLVLGHRGAPTEQPENTLAAFARALEVGADGVELDVRRTRDDVLVIHHDPVVAGLGEDGGAAPIIAHTFAELQSRASHIPTLEQALDVLRGSLVNIEVKNSPIEPDFDVEHRAVAEIVALLAERRNSDRDGDSDRVVVSSFNLATIDRCRALDGTVPTGLLALAGFDLTEALETVNKHGHSALHPNVASLADGIGARIVSQAAALGVLVNVWTVDSQEDLIALGDVGVHAVITNHPEIARRLYDDRYSP